MENQLCIGVANPNAHAIEEYTLNLLEHSNKFLFAAYEGHPALGRIYATLLALRNGALKTPFVLMDADSVILEPISESEDVDIIFHRNEEDKRLQEILQPRIKRFLKDHNLESVSISWLPLGNTLLFNKLDENLLIRAIARGEELVKEEGDDFDVERAAWILAFHDFLGKYTYGGEFYELSLLHNDVKAPFIHYQRGLPPDFVKRNFTFNGGAFGFLAAGGSPYNALLKNNPTTTTDRIQEIVRSYLERKDAQVARKPV